MEKRYGSPVRQDGLTKVGRNKWDLFYGFGKNNEEDETGWNWYQRFNYKPTLDEIKATIIQVIESESTYRMRYGLVWNQMPVEYTEERKSDLTGILVALQSGIMQLPITLNLGSWSDGSPVFHDFTTSEEIASVASALLEHKTAVCQEEWIEKASIDWSVYETE